MKINNRGLELVKSFEGCRLKAYKCPAGVWTIGYGHTAGVTSDMVITQEEAEQFLREDMAKYERSVESACANLGLGENQFSALVSFAYNCGTGNLKKLIKNRTLSQIADAMLLYNKGGGKVLKGLERRRKAERELFLLDSIISEKPKTEVSSEEKLQQEKTECASHFDKTLAGSYTVNASSLNMRVGVGKNKKRITLLANKTKVRCYGYYSVDSKNVKWLLVTANGYTGFCSSEYLIR